MVTGLVVDLFAGGGGASVGIEAALGRTVDLAINHDPVALAVHRANHPGTRHLEADIWEVKPREAIGGAAVDLLWASPDCTHFSVAKGNVPRSQGIRSLAWVVVDWARETRPAVIALENVQEFRGWGPLGDDGRPDKARMGETFELWRRQLEHLGYVVDHRVLDASLFGAPTRRRRLFLVARCDGRPIVWPEPTHGPGRLPVRMAAECIDWSLPCPSIFERRRPLAEKDALADCAGHPPVRARDAGAVHRADGSRRGCSGWRDAPARSRCARCPRAGSDHHRVEWRWRFRRDGPVAGRDEPQQRATRRRLTARRGDEPAQPLPVGRPDAGADRLWRARRPAPSIPLTSTSHSAP